MAIINIEIDIKNPKEIIEKEKGKLTEIIAVLFMDSKKLKSQVESAVCTEIIKLLQPKIAEGLSEKGVLANVRFSVSKDKG